MNRLYALLFCSTPRSVRTFSSTYSTSPIIMKFYQQVRFIERSKVAKFEDDVTSIDGVMTSQNDFDLMTFEFDDVISPSKMSALL